MTHTIHRLQILVAWVSVLSQKSRLCHWNVEWAGFLELHEFFGAYYDFLSNEVDNFAERIRALDNYPKATFQEFLSISPIEEQGGMTSKEMIQTLLHDTEIITTLVREWIQDESDLITQDMFISFIYDLEKKAWMMKSLKKVWVIG